MVDRANFVPRVDQSTRTTPGAGPTPDGKTFAETLSRETLKVSSHAQKRLNASQVTLTDSHMSRLDGAVARADQKGANQSVIMLDNLALVVSVKNRVVITAIDDSRMKDAVFTNIDSVVIA